MYQKDIGGLKVKEKFKTLLKVYRKLISEIYRVAPLMVIFTFIVSIIFGLITPLSIFVNRHILNEALPLQKGR